MQEKKTLHTAHARAPKLGRQYTSNLSLHREGGVVASRSYLIKKHQHLKQMRKKNKEKPNGKKKKQNERLPGLEPASSNSKLHPNDLDRRPPFFFEKKCRVYYTRSYGEPCRFQRDTYEQKTPTFNKRGNNTFLKRLTEKTREIVLFTPAEENPLSARLARHTARVAPKPRRLCPDGLALLC